ncbi:MAG: ATP-dependent DNA helicase RecG [Anaerolineae bacterium]|nr:ATP-dependent DNA helicase RecG [Anaerolineae bacterium]
MIASVKTLLKILDLERQKGYQNNAVIGGFSRFSFHWAREALARPGSEEQKAAIEQIATHLRSYDSATSEDRPGILHTIVTLAGQRFNLNEAAPTVRTRPAQQAPRPRQGQDTRQQRPQPFRGRGEETTGDYIEILDQDTFEVLEPAEQQLLPVRERRGYARRPAIYPDAAVLQELDAPVSTAKGVGASRAEQLNRLGLNTIQDMLRYFPRRYEDYTRMRIVKDLRPGEVVSVIGLLERIQSVSMKNGGKRVEAYLADESGSVRLNWFNQPWVEKQLRQGSPVVVRGKTDQFLGRVVINSPDIEEIESDALATGRIVPIYGLTNGLTSGVMRNIMSTVVNTYARHLPDYLPLAIRERTDLMDYADAVAQAHFPDTSDDMDSAQIRLAFDEVFIRRVAMLRRRREWQSAPGEALTVSNDWIETFEHTLGFTFTDAQRKAIDEIRADMSRNVPMNRLLQGDVGSGKTAVAAVCLGIAAANGVQGVLMAPTSILAEQHFAKIQALLAANPHTAHLRVGLLTGHVPQAERQEVYDGAASGAIHVLIGTHALIQEGIAFANLGAVVIDEQHRFGVEQRHALRGKANGGNPHLLVMTATPIPRTLMLTIHSDLDLTVLDQLPPGRTPVQTRVLQPKERERAYAFINAQIDKGRQAFVICPLVEDSEDIDARSAVSEYERLQKTAFRGRRLGLLHGRMKAAEKDAVRESFYAGELDVLVSTTVIEVGIDVPNASVIMVENANRFGLAQLHQLRGRVGRGEHESTCLLVSDQPFLDADDRLAAMERTSDGFELARVDMDLRGPGEALRTLQSGGEAFQFTSRITPQLLEQVQQEGQLLFESDPLLEKAEHLQLADLIAALLEDAEHADIS